MKKFLALFLALVMLLSLVACGGNKEPAPEPEPEPEPAPEPVEPPVPDEPPKPAGKSLEANLWTLTYDDSVWTYNEEDDLNDQEEYSSLNIMIPNPDSEDENLIWISIRASIEDAEDFRDYLDNYGFDAREFAENNAYEFTQVGNMEFLSAEGTYWGSPCLRYLNRFEGAGATVLIEITGEYEDARVAELLAGLEFKLPDTGNVDFPWPWNGVPYAAEEHNAMVGTVSLNSKWIPITDCIVTRETFEHAAAVVGDQAYLLVDGALAQYAFDGESLSFVSDIALADEYQVLKATSDGNLWLSSFMKNLIALKDGTQVAAYEGPDYVAMSDDGTWGISYFTGTECELISFADGVMSTEPIVFSEVKSVRDVFVEGDKIFVTGISAETDEYLVFIYGKDAVLKQTLTDGDGGSLGSITYITETPNGYLALDGNMREVVLWNKDGAYIGALDDDELFGTSYPWFCGGTKLSDGSILVLLTEDRADKSAMELAAYRLSGF